MLSRVADAVYWMHRYLERAENVARFVDVTLHLVLDLNGGEGEKWDALIRATGDEHEFRARIGQPAQASALHFLTFDTLNHNSILSCLKAARENARSVREVISSEMWEQLNKAYLWTNEAARWPGALDVPHAFYAEVKQAAHLFAGITERTMSHNEAWHFGRLGELIERADKTTRIVGVNCELEPKSAQSDEAIWASLLKSASALEMYRKVYGRIEPRRVIGFLLFDRHFPRSVRYCLASAEHSLHVITGNPSDASSTPAERRVARLRAALENAEPSELERDLPGYVDRLVARISEAGAAIGETFFTPHQR